MLLTAARALLGDELVGPVTVEIAAGRVRRAEPGAAARADVHLPDGLLVPGFVDLQVNGAFGVDLAGAPVDDWRAVRRALPVTGVTAFLPTLITAPLEALRAQLAVAAAAAEGEEGARMLGVHVEGPYISPRYVGVHDPAHLRRPDDGSLDALADLQPALLRLLTLAPELPGGLDAVRRLSDRGVAVSIGHSDASAADVAAAADAGARGVTHLFNAQRGLHHREPGVVGAALTDERLTLGLIADLHHVAPAVCRLAFAAAGHRIALVTDAIAAAGMPPGDYVLAGQRIVVAADGPPRRGDGTIAGSALVMDAAVRNLAGLGLPLAQVLLAATRTPADLIGRADLGRIAPGAAADLVWLSPDLVPLRTWIGGAAAYTAEGMEPA